MPPKRKADVKQPSLEETVEKPVTKVKTRGTEKQIVEGDTKQQDLVAAKMARKHGQDPAFHPKAKEGKQDESKKQQSSSSNPEQANFVDINRAPVLTLWVTVVAQRQGYSQQSALTFGKAIAGLMANAKGRSIGIIGEKEPPDEKTKGERATKEAELGIQKCKVFGMEIKALTEGEEPRAVDSSGSGEQAVKHSAVQQYLSRAFGARLQDVEEVMKQLADSFSTEEIGDEAYHLYEQFRPNVVSGQQGWGKKGRLDLDGILDLKK